MSLNKGIKTKLIISLVLTTLVVLIVFFGILNIYLKDYSQKEAAQTIFFLGDNASSLLQKPLFNSDYNQLGNIARSIHLDDFEYLMIYDNMTGNVAFKKDSAGITDKLIESGRFKMPQTLHTEDIQVEGRSYIQYLFPVTLESVSKPLGYLVIGVSADKLRSKLQPITYRLLVISGLLFVTLALTIYFFSNRIARPLKALSQKIETFAGGDYSVRADIRTSDEIGNLAQNFNIMANKINDQILSIEGYNKNLEKMVEERTQELLVALDDIKEKDKRLNQAEKISSLHSVVSAIAHEINNPLAIISGNLQLLEARAADDFVKKKVHVAQEAIQRIATLIDEINFFSAIKDIFLAPIQFSTLLSTAVHKIIPEDVSITIDGTEDDKITSNQNLITLALENVLQNSIDQFNLKEINGEIRVVFYKEIYYLVVEITDNAGGIEEPGKVFDPFYTTFNEKKGLGLTFVYHGIQALNGIITVENMNAGAKITMQIPIGEPNQEGSGNIKTD